jgi:hypothetical protein
MNSLYNEYNARNKSAEDFLFSIELDINNLFKMAVENYGYDPRQVSHLLICHITGVEAEIVLRQAIDMKKRKRNRE